MQIHYAKQILASNLPPLDCIKASYSTHSFARHWDEPYIIQLVERGTNVFHCRGEERHAPEGSIVLINPGDIHTGKSLGEHLLIYRTFYPSIEWMNQFMGNEKHLLGSLPYFTTPVIHHPQLAAMLLNAHHAVESGRDPFQVEVLLLEAIKNILVNCSNYSSELPAYHEPESITVVKEYLHDNFAESISLQQLSSVTGLSPYYLIRSFKRQTGMPPHEYLVNVRIQRGKAFLKEGNSIAECAFKTGFADQSHFHRNFKRIVGLTPGEFVRKSNFVQDFQ